MTNIDQVKIRIRTHTPNTVTEREFSTIEEALSFLQSYKSSERSR